MQAWQHLFVETRARVYLLWAVIASGGFVATHYYQRKPINGVWFVLAAVGLAYMFRVMPLKVRQMRQIFLAWAVPIAVGMIVSGLVFYIEAQWAYDLIAHLGAFWLVVLAVGYLWNGLVDPPAGWYYLAALLNLVAGLLCFRYADWASVQYLVAAIISGWSMLNLWLFRS